MTVTTLPTFKVYPVINLLVSDKETDVEERDWLLENYLLDSKKGKKLPESFTMNNLAVYCFGNQFPREYYQVRNFARSTQEALKKENRDVLTTGLALIYNEGLDVKEDCKKIHSSYSSGGAYLFSRKFLFALLLTKSGEFRDFAEIHDYQVPFELRYKKNAIISYLLAK